MATVTGRPSRSPLKRGRARRRPRSRVSRCWTRTAASSERRRAPPNATRSRARVAQDGDGGGQLLGRRFAPIGGPAADAEHGFRDLRLGGRHRTAGEELEIANVPPAQDEGVDREAPAALGGEEGDDVRPLGGEAGQGVALAPGAPGTDPGAVGAASVFRLGAGGHRRCRRPERSSACRRTPGFWSGRRVDHRVGEVGRRDSGGR